MKKLLQYIVLFTFTFANTACEKSDDARAQVAQAEADFNDYAAKYGVKEAFLTFAADSAVISRGGKIYKGKAGISQYFDAQTYLSVKLIWSPDVVEISSSGDLAYTYGPYLFEAINADSTLINSGGIFHTVWKKQADGSWKFVFD